MLRSLFLVWSLLLLTACSSSESAPRVAGRAAAAPAATSVPAAATVRPKIGSL